MIFFYQNYFIKRQIHSVFIQEVKLGDLLVTPFGTAKGFVALIDDRNIKYVYLLDKERYRNMYNASFKNQKKYNSKNYDKLIEKIMSNDFKYDNTRPIIIEGDSNIILDGQHRATILAYKYGLQYKIKVITLY